MHLDIFERGPRAWKLNKKLPLDVRYKEFIKKNIAETTESSPHLNPNDRWCCAIKDKNEKLKLQCLSLFQRE